MKVNKEIDALLSLGISPVSYLVAPRIVGMVASIVLLMFYFSATSVLGGYIISSLSNPLPFSEFMYQFSRALSVWDIVIMISKVTICGFMIGGICTFQSLQVNLALTEIPQRNIKAVTHCVIVVMGINLIFLIGEIYTSDLGGLAKYASY